MCKMIILKAKKNFGKTSTLINLRDILSRNGAKKIYSDKLGKKGTDILTIFKYTNSNKNSLTIIIISAGDNKKLMDYYKIALKEYSNPNIIFGASRTKGNTTDIIKKVSKKYKFDIIWTSPYSNEKDNEKLNEKRANELFSTFIK